MALTGTSTVTAPSSGTSDVTYTVTLSPASEDTATVNYATADGTAVVGTDYTASSGTLTFNPAETTKTFTVTIDANSNSASSKTFNVALSSNLFASLTSPSSITVTISGNSGGGGGGCALNPSSFSFASILFIILGFIPMLWIRKVRE